MASAGRDVNHHTHYHFHEAPNLEIAQSSLLSSLAATDNFRGIHQDNLARATPKTGEWMFGYETFTVWRNPQSDLDTLWGTGIREFIFLFASGEELMKHTIAGAGKTVVTYIFPLVAP